MEKAVFCEEAVRTVAREKGAGHRNRGRAMPQDKSFGLEATFLRTARRSGVQTVTREKGAGDQNAVTARVSQCRRSRRHL